MTASGLATESRVIASTSLYAADRATAASTKRVFSAEMINVGCQPGLAHPERVWGVFQRVDLRFDAQGAELVLHLGAADLQRVLFPLDEDRWRHAGAHVRDGRGGPVDVAHFGARAAEEFDGAFG